MKRTVLLITIASLFVLPVRSDPRGRAAAPPKAPAFQRNQLEAYLSDDGIAYIRPGLKLTLLSVTNVAPRLQFMAATAAIRRCA